MTSQKKRLNLELTPEAYNLLQQIAEETGKNMADVLRTGLALVGIAQEAKKKGQKISITNDNDEIVKETVIM